MNAIEMLERCRARQHNVPATDGTTEPVLDTPHFAEDIEPFIGGTNALPALGELQAEAARLGLTD